ncbi:MAG: hypothetical protein ACFCGT_02775 [Sandaracinaceae bacterium]
MRRRTVVSLAACGAALALGASPASATISEAYTFDELVAEASQIAVAVAGDRRGRRDAAGRIVTEVDLRIEETWKGSAAPGAIVPVVRLGGVIGDIGMRVEGEPALVEGRRYVVFLTRLDDGTLRPLGMSQGVLPVRDGSTGRVVLPGGAGLRLVRWDDQGRLVSASPAIDAPTPLADVRARVARALAGPEAPARVPRETPSPRPGGGAGVLRQ